MNGIYFAKVGSFRISEFHVCSVQFFENGSATVHTMTNAVSTSEPDEVRALREMVGDQPRQSQYPPPADPPADPPAGEPQIHLVKEEAVAPLAPDPSTIDPSTETE